MSSWQILYLALLGAALFGGRPRLRVWAAMLINLALTMAFASHDSIIFVAAIDLFCASLLIGKVVRYNIVAMLFASMPPIYAVGETLGWNQSTTYAIVDIIAYLQCLVIGRFDYGINHMVRHYNSRRGYLGRYMVSWHNAESRPQVVSSESEGLESGR